MRFKFIIAVTLVVLISASVIFAQPDPVKVSVPTGWETLDQEYRYDRESLWEYINGAAELFISYGFRELIVLDVGKGDSALTISVYDMGSSLDAFGVFEREKPVGGKSIVGIGASAVMQPPYRGLFLKDRFYVKIDIGGDDVSSEQLKQAMSDIAAGLPGTDELPAQLAALPEPGRKPGSVAFAGQNFMGLSELRNCLHAIYQKPDDTEYQLFVMQPRKSFLNDIGNKWTAEEHSHGKLLIWREIPYSGIVVMLGDDSQLTGVAGLNGYDEAVALLESLTH